MITFTEFLKVHDAQIKHSGIPRIYLRSLFNKLYQEIFDAGEFFKIIIEESQNEGGDLIKTAKVIVIVENGIKRDDDDKIFLIDHAWVYEAKTAKYCLENIVGLDRRLANLMSVKCDIDEILDEMWKYNQYYSVISENEIENKLPLWYIMDEFGHSIRHCDEPNFKIVPFVLKDRTSFTLLFPMKDVKFGEEVTRDYVDGVKNKLIREILLLPWQPKLFTTYDAKHISLDNANYFMSGRKIEILPTNNSQLKFKDDKIFNVYSEYRYVNENLTHPRFKLVNQEKSADILWYTYHFTNYDQLDDQYVNQFPYENVITVKDLLSIISRRILPSPSWNLETYNLALELPQFVSHFQDRQNNNYDNHWICKPWNLARSLDTLITKNLNCILKLSVTTFSKIAQKYIENPVLFDRSGTGLVKFDLRYIVLLKDTAPLTCCVYTNFFTRFANLEFSLDDLYNYEKHFTVMNYVQAPLCKMLCNEFIVEFEKQNTTVKWADVEKKIFKMLKEIFTVATMKKPPLGIGDCKKSRAIYAVDLMLAYDENNEIEPKLLEINWTPDCQRACEYYPNFYNDIFSCLFLNETVDTIKNL